MRAYVTSTRRTLLYYDVIIARNYREASFGQNSSVLKGSTNYSDITAVRTKRDSYLKKKKRKKKREKNKSKKRKKGKKISVRKNRRREWYFNM